MLPETAKITGGKVEIGSLSLGTATIPAGVELVIPSGQTLTVNAVLTATGDITNNGTIVLGGGGSISRYVKVANINGTIKTSQVAKLTTLFTSGVTAGTVEVTCADITIEASARITVPTDVTLAIGNGTDTATLTLASGATPGKLVLSANAKLAVLNAESEFAGVATVEVAGAGSKALADNGGGGTDWTVTAVDTVETTAKNIILGKLKLTISSSGEISVSADEGAPGTLTADTGTTITFAGTVE